MILLHMIKCNLKILNWWDFKAAMRVEESLQYYQTMHSYDYLWFRLYVICWKPVAHPFLKSAIQDWYSIMSMQLREIGEIELT